MIPWGRDLADRGYSVSVPRLPGHGTHWKDMNTTGWEDWYTEADNALTDLRDRCESVLVAGLSMGGCLALRLAQQRPADVEAIVVVNPAIALKNRALFFLPLLKFVVPSLPGIGNDIKKTATDEIGYDKVPLHALASQLKMWKEVRANLGKITQPMLYFKSDVDHVVDPSSRDLIMTGVSSQTADLIALHDSYHVATIDNDAQLIFDTTAEFIAQYVGTARD
jgi:carboxylesterase